MLGRIARHLKISVSAIMDGITQEQADQITELTIQECDVELLKHFKNLKKLKIKPNLRDMGITLDLDISNMEKLESLDIIVTDGITNINIDNAQNLNAINISENKGLEKTTGLEDLKELKTLLMVDNNVLKEIPDIQSIAHGQNIETLQVDFDWLHLFEEKYGNLDKIQDDDVMKNKVTLIEKMGRFIYPLELDKGIEAEKVDCRYWDEEDEEITDYIHPKNSNHSIIRFKTKDGWFYSDPTFDSMDASEGWRKSFRFNIPKEQYQEVLEIHQQMEEKFEQGEIESPEEKVEPTEYGVK